MLRAEKGITEIRGTKIGFSLQSPSVRYCEAAESGWKLLKSQEMAAQVHQDYWILKSYLETKLLQDQHESTAIDNPRLNSRYWWTSLDLIAIIHVTQLGISTLESPKLSIHHEKQ